MTQGFSNFVPFGSAMPKSGIQKFSAKKGDTRIRILSTAEGNFLLAKTHYLKGVGSFHCFGGSCCSVCANAPEGESNSQERAILPIAVAAPSVAGGFSTEYCYLALPETKYSQLVSLNQNVGDITTYDILIQCTDEQYQKYTFLPVMNQASVFLTSPEEVTKATNFLDLYKSTIMGQLGKTLDEASFQAARAKSLQSAAGAVGVQFTPNPTASQAFSQPAVMPALPTVNPTPVASIPTAVPLGATVQPSVVPTQPVAEVVAPQSTVVPPVVNVATPVQETVVEATPVVPTTPVVEATPTVATVETVPAQEAQTETAEVDWSAFMTQG